MRTNELAQLVLWDTESEDDPIVMVTLPVNPDLDLTSKLEAVILHAVKEVYPCPENWTMAQVLAEYMGNIRGPLYEFSRLNILSFTNGEIKVTRYGWNREGDLEGCFENLQSKYGEYNEEEEDEDE